MRIFYFTRGTDGVYCVYTPSEVVALARLAGPRGLEGGFWFRGVPPSSRGGAWNWEAPSEAVVGVGRFAPCLSFGVRGRIVYQHERLAPAPDGWLARFSWAREGFAVYPAQDLANPGEVEAGTAAPQYVPAPAALDPIRRVQAAVAEAAAAEWPRVGEQGHLAIHACGEAAVRAAATGWIAVTMPWHWRPRHRVLNHLVFGANVFVPVRLGDELLAWADGNRLTVASPDHLGQRWDGAGPVLLRHPLPEVAD